MLLSKGSVTRHSLGLSALVLAAAGLLSAAMAGCFFVDGHGSHSHPEGDPGTTQTDPPPDTTTDPGIVGVSIQPDQVLAQEPGKGVGIFIEVTSAGQWHVWTTCDTFASNQVCTFDIILTAPVDTFTYAADQLEDGQDTVKDLGAGSIELVTGTDSNADGVFLDLDPTLPLTVESYLDGKSAEAFVYWVSDDIVHAGAPANPIELTPAVATTH